MGAGNFTGWFCEIFADFFRRPVLGGLVARGIFCACRDSLKQAGDGCKVLEWELDFFVVRSILFGRRGLRCHPGVMTTGYLRCESLGKFVGGDSGIQWRLVSSFLVVFELLIIEYMNRVDAGNTFSARWNGYCSKNCVTRNGDTQIITKNYKPLD